MIRPRLLTAGKSAKYLGVSITQFHRWRNDDNQPAIPQPVYRAGRPFFLVEELDGFVDQLKTLRSAK